MFPKKAKRTKAKRMGIPLRKSGFSAIWRKYRQSILVVGLFSLLGVGLWIRDVQTAKTPAGTVIRASQGGETTSQRFSYHLESTEESSSRGETSQESDLGEEIMDALGEQEISLSVSPVAMDQEVAQGWLEEAVAEWEALYLAENESVDAVRTGLNLPAVLCDGWVTVSYESSNPAVVTTKGVVSNSDVPQEGQLVTLTVKLSCGEYMRIETVYLLVLPPQEGSSTWLVSRIQALATEAETESRQEESFSLPETILGYRIVWEEEAEPSWLYLPILGVAVALCLEWRRQQEEKERRKRRLRQLELEYPRMVDQLVILLDSGMTIRRAWERMMAQGEGSVGKGKKRHGVSGDVFRQEMRLTYREICEGRGEREAYERFGRRIGLLSYRRFSSLLAQNLSKGSSQLKGLLQRESAEALEQRKTQARKRGEEAATKLLFPMLVMLLLILIVLLLPALTSL